MNPSELFFGILLVLALLGLAGFFAWRQFKTRLALARDRDMSPEERRFLVSQTRRRLFCSILMFLFAGFLIGWFFIEPRLPAMVLAAEKEPAKAHPLVELVAYYWIAALLVLFGIFALAAMDFFATARFGMHQKKLLVQRCQEPFPGKGS